MVAAALIVAGCRYSDVCGGSPFTFTERESVEPVAKHGGGCSLHIYSFEGVGKAHGGYSGSNVSGGWSVEWPEPAMGLGDDILEAVRRRVVEIAFAGNYWGYDKENPPKTLSDAEAAFKAELRRRLRCDGADENHICSHWDFVVDAKAYLPFGLEGGEAWYARPVMCLTNDGYANDGGNGCHSYFVAEVVSLADGRRLCASDYFAVDKLDALGRLAFVKMLEQNGLSIDDTFEGHDTKVSADDLEMTVGSEGVTWTFPAYSVMAGCFGVLSATIPWGELEPYRRSL